MDAAAALDQIDAVRARTGASYADCWRALQDAGGDTVRAVVRLEDDLAERDRAGGRADLAARVLRAAGAAAAVRIAVRRGPRTLVEVPAIAGAAVALLLPRVAALGVLVALAARCSLVMERGPGEGAFAAPFPRRGVRPA